MFNRIRFIVTLMFTMILCLAALAVAAPPDLAPYVAPETLATCMSPEVAAPVLGLLWAFSEVLALFPRVKANGIFHAVRLLLAREKP